MNPIPESNFNLASDAPTRRHILLAGSAALLTGCSVPHTITNLVNVTGLLVLGAPDAPFTPDYVKNLPYATLTAKIGRAQRALLVLAEYDGPDLRWVSANDAALVTRNGRLIKTAGLERNLRSTHGLEDDPIANKALNFAGAHMRSIDLAPDGPFGVPIGSTFEVLGRESIKILGNSHDTLVVRESNRAQSIRWKFNNTYWLDSQTGFMWKSVQHFDPSTKPVEIQITKPAMPAAV